MATLGQHVRINLNSRLLDFLELGNITVSNELTRYVRELHSHGWVAKRLILFNMYSVSRYSSGS